METSTNLGWRCQCTAIPKGQLKSPFALQQLLLQPGLLTHTDTHWHTLAPPPGTAPQGNGARHVMVHDEHSVG
jgi:hypothetical protein